MHDFMRLVTLSLFLLGTGIVYSSGDDGQQRAERLSEAFMNRLLQWSPSGFSVHADPPSPRLRRAGLLVFDNEPERLEKRASYLTRAPIRLGSITETPEGRVHVRTPPHPLTGNTVLVLDALDWIHAIGQQIIPGGVASK